MTLEFIKEAHSNTCISGNKNVHSFNVWIWSGEQNLEKMNFSTNPIDALILYSTTNRHRLHLKSGSTIEMIDLFFKFVLSQRNRTAAMFNVDCISFCLFSNTLKGLAYQHYKFWSIKIKFCHLLLHDVSLSLNWVYLIVSFANRNF